MTPLYAGIQDHCPMRAKVDENQGCFYSCQFFQRKRNKRPTQKAYLRMIDRKIVAVLEKIS
jgi:hypothetical protein